MLGYNKIFADTFDRHFFNKLFFLIKTQAHFFGHFLQYLFFFLNFLQHLDFMHPNITKYANEIQ